jgi:hypothetical protein
MPRQYTQETHKHTHTHTHIVHNDHHMQITDSEVTQATVLGEGGRWRWGIL